MFVCVVVGGCGVGVLVWVVVCVFVCVCVCVCVCVQTGVLGRFIFLSQLQGFLVHSSNHSSISKMCFCFNQYVPPATDLSLTYTFIFYLTLRQNHFLFPLFPIS